MTLQRISFKKCFFLVLDEKNIKYYKALIQHNELYGLATDDHFGYITYDRLFDSKKYDFTQMELKKSLVPGFEKIFPLNNNDALLLTTKGLTYYNNSKKLKEKGGLYFKNLRH